MNFERRVEALVKAQGACAFGFAQALPVPEEERLLFDRWLADGCHAGMEYMQRNRDVRFDPRLLLEGAKTVISVAFNYRQPNPRPEIATYALGEDYHRVLKRRLGKVVDVLREEFGGEYRICVDSAPILERFWAVRCGVGNRSEAHGNIVVPGVGSMVFLAEILTTLQWHSSHNIEVPPDTCESEECRRCCPTGALLPGGIVDARKCVNYLTIEHKGEWSEEQKRLLQLPGARERVFGCDICQLACSYNRDYFPPILPEFENNPEISRRKSPLSRAKKRR